MSRGRVRRHSGVILGVTVLRGVLKASDLSLVAEVCGLGVMLAGVATLAASPIVTGQLAALERRREEGRAYQTATTLERLLGETENAITACQTSLAERHANPDIDRSLRSAERHIHRLEQLLGEMERHHKQEILDLHALPPKERMTLAVLEDELDRRQKEIEAWAGRLRHDFERIAVGLRMGAMLTLARVIG